MRLSPQPRKIPEKGIVSEAASPVRLGASRTGETRRSSRSLLGSGSGGASGRSPGRSGYSERLSSGRHSALGSYGRTTTAASPSRATGNTASTTAAGSARSPTRRSASALGSYASSRRAGGSADLASARLRNSPYSSGYRSSDLFSSPYAASQLSSLTRTSQRSRASPASTTAASLRSPSTAGTTASTRSSTTRSPSRTGTALMSCCLCVVGWLARVWWRRLETDRVSFLINLFAFPVPHPSCSIIIIRTSCGCRRGRYHRVADHANKHHSASLRDHLPGHPHVALPIAVPSLSTTSENQGEKKKDCVRAMGKCDGRKGGGTRFAIPWTDAVDRAVEAVCSIIRTIQENQARKRCKIDVRSFASGALKTIGTGVSRGAR